MSFIEYPKALVPVTRNARIDARTRSPGESITGREQIQVSGLARWLIDVELTLGNRDRVLAFQALQASLGGRANYTNVTFIAGITAPKILPMINGTVYRGNKLVPPPGVRLRDLGVLPTLISGANAGSMQVEFDPGTCEGIQAGCDFSIGNRLYRIRETVGNIAYISPKLRDPVSAGAVMEFWRPSCYMGLVADDSADATIGLGRFGSATITFVEYW